MASKKKTGGAIKEKAYVSNYPPLQEWLQKHEARCDWQIPLGPPTNPTAYVEAWRFRGGAVAIITVFANMRGWDIFTPDRSGKVAEALTDAEIRLGIAEFPAAERAAREANKDPMPVVHAGHRGLPKRTS